MGRCRLAASAVILLIGLLGSSAPASAALLCRDVFAGKREGALGHPEAQDIADDIDMALVRLGIDLNENVPFSKADVDLVLGNARRLLEIQGAQVHEVEFQGERALEIIPVRSESGWNRMAESLLRVKKTRLLYAPLFLLRENAIGARERGDDGSTILISRASLLHGRGEQNTLHEIRHVHVDSTRDEKPTIFHSQIETVGADAKARIAKDVTTYTQDMSLDEIKAFSENLKAFSRDFKREDSVSLRRKLRSVSETAIDVALTAAEAARFAQSSASQITARTVLRSGPVMKSDGGFSSGSAYLTMKLGPKVFIKVLSPKAVQIQVEHRKLLATITRVIPEGQHEALKSLVRLISVNDPGAQEKAKAWIAGELTQWSEAMAPVAARFEDSVREILKALDHRASAAELSQLAAAAAQ